MRTSLTVSCAIVALAVLSSSANAGQRAEAFYDGAGIVVVQDRYDGYDGRDYGDFRRHGRGDRFDGLIPERRIVRRLIRQGFVSVEDIDLRRDRYVVRAVRPNGALIRLLIDAYDGEVLSRERIGWARDGGYRRRGDGGRDPSGLELDLGGGSLGIYRR